MIGSGPKHASGGDDQQSKIPNMTLTEAVILHILKVTTMCSYVCARALVGGKSKNRKVSPRAFSTWEYCSYRTAYRECRTENDGVPRQAAFDLLPLSSTSVNVYLLPTMVVTENIDMQNITPL